MKKTLIIFLLLPYLLLLSACKTSSDSPAEPSPVPEVAPERVDLLFRFHSLCLDQIQKCNSYKDLEAQSNSAQAARDGILREVSDPTLPGYERARLLRRLDVAYGAETLAYVDRYTYLRTLLNEQLSYIQNSISDISRSLSVWDESDVLSQKNLQLASCVAEFLLIGPDAFPLGLESQFRACIQTVTEAKQRYAVIRYRGAEIRDTIIRSLNRPN